MPQIYGSLTNNYEIGIGWLGLVTASFTITCNQNQLQELTIILLSNLSSLTDEHSPQSLSPSTTDFWVELLYDWRFPLKHFFLAKSPLRPMTSNFIFQLNTYGYFPYVTYPLSRGWVYRLQLLLVSANAVILRPESRGTYDHIILSEIRDFPNLEDQIPVFISPTNSVAKL
jgi:hypothetical protein